jgi:hypothetical protein
METDGVKQAGQHDSQGGTDCAVAPVHLVTDNPHVFFDLPDGLAAASSLPEETEIVAITQGMVPGDDLQ